MTTILHKIKAYLYDNVLTKDNPNDFTARTVSERSLSVEDICNAAAAEFSTVPQKRITPISTAFCSSLIRVKSSAQKFPE